MWYRAAVRHSTHLPYPPNMNHQQSPSHLTTAIGSGDMLAFLAAYVDHALCKLQDLLPLSCAVKTCTAMAWGIAIAWVYIQSLWVLP